MKEQRRRDRLAAYRRLVDDRPHLFVNPPGAAHEILFDEVDQEFIADRDAADNQSKGMSVDDADIGVIYRDRFVTLVRDAVRFRSGHRGAYIRLLGTQPGTGSAVLPLLSDGRVVLIRHFRHADRRWHWEIPRGFAEGSSTGAETAGRELVEELGCRAQKVERLGATNGDTGLRAQLDEIYLAHITTEAFDAASAEGAEEEGIDEVRAVSLPDFREMIRNGEITDGFTLSAFALATASGVLP